MAIVRLFLFIAGVILMIIGARWNPPTWDLWKLGTALLALSFIPVS